MDRDYSQIHAEIDRVSGYNSISKLRISEDASDWGERPQMIVIKATFSVLSHNWDGFQNLVQFFWNIN
jgi:hypothetical protein